MTAAPFSDRPSGPPPSRVPGRPPSGPLPPRRPTSPAGAAGRTIGGYRVLETLGRGGMGVVYRCRDSMGREVALKTITTAALGRLDDRLRREAQAIARLRHQNIVGLIAVDEDDGRPFVVMDLVRGESLDRTLLRNGPLPPARAAAIVRDIARALEHAHAEGVTHRDIKPANILIDEHGDPRLTDFGLAADASATTQLTATGQIVGTLQYMAPEQADGDRSAHGPHTDIWAAGAVLYACLTGKPPFDGDDVMQVVKKVLLDAPTPPRRLQPWVPEGLERVVLRCLAKEREQRWASAEELAEALEPFAHGEDVLSESIRVRRSSTAVAVASVGFGLGLAVLVMALAWRSAGEDPAPPADVTTSDAPAPPERAPPTAPRPTDSERRDALVEDGEAAIASGDLAEAATLADEALGIDGGSADAAHLRALVLMRRQSDPRPVIVEAIDDAISRFEILEEDGAETARDLFRLGELLRLRRRFVRAADCLRRALSPERSDPLEPGDRLGASLALARALVPDTATTDPAALAEAIAVLEAVPDPLLVGDDARRSLAHFLIVAERYERGFEQALLYARERPTRADSWLELLQLADARLPHHADAVVAEARKHHPDHPILLARIDAPSRGSRAELDVLWEEVSRNQRIADPTARGAAQARAFERYLELGSSDPTDLARMGVTARHAGRAKEAVQLLEAALRPGNHAALGADRWSAHVVLAEAKRLAYPDLAPADLARLALESLPPAEEMPVAHVIRLERAKLELALGALDAALATIEPYVATGPNESGAYRVAVTCLLQRGENTRAARVASDALGRELVDTVFWLARGMDDLTAGRFAFALENHQRALASATTPVERDQARYSIALAARGLHDLPMARTTLGDLETSGVDQGQVRALRATLDELAGSGPELAPALVQRGALALRAFDPEAARRLAEAAIALDERDPNALWLLSRACYELRISGRLDARDTQPEREAATRALALYDLGDGAEVRDLVRASALLVRMRRDAEAGPLLERALGRAEQLEPPDLGDLLLVRVLWREREALGANPDAAARRAAASAAVAMLEEAEAAGMVAPAGHRVRSLLAQWLLDTNRVQEAIVVLRDYVAVQRYHEDARRLLDGLTSDRSRGGD